LPRNGTGSYSLPYPPVVPNTPISSTVYNGDTTDIATALTGSVARNGESPMTGSLPMGGFKVTGMADGMAADDGAAIGQVAVRRIQITQPTASPIWLEFPMSASYNSFQADFAGVSPAATTNLIFQISEDAGATWISAAGSYSSGWTGNLSAPGYAAATLATAGFLTHSATSLAGGSCTARAVFSGGAAQYFYFTCTSSIANGGTFVVGTHGGSATAVSTPNRIRFGWSGSTWLNQGSVTFCGIAAS